MSVQLQPDSTLGFHRPLTQLVKRTLTVSNSNSHAVAFKVKTTAPKQYCVRPNSGRIEAGERVEVQVLLQPMKEDPPSSVRCRDKFLVQSVAIDAEHEALPLPELWSAVEKEGKGNVHEQKIRCSYLPPVDGEGAENGVPPVAGAAALTNGHSTPPNVGVRAALDRARLRMQDSQLSRASSSPTMADASSKINGAAVESPSVGPAQPMADAESRTPTTSSEAPAPAASSSIPSVAAATVAASAAAGGLAAAAAKAAGVPENKIKAMVPDSSVSAADQDAAALRSRLQAAEAEVSRLRAQSGSDGLRQRSVKSAAAPGASSSAAVAQKPVGIPLNVVAGLMLAAFVMGVLLF